MIKDHERSTKYTPCKKDIEATPLQTVFDPKDERILQQRNVLSQKNIEIDPTGDGDNLNTKEKLGVIERDNKIQEEGVDLTQIPD